MLYDKARKFIYRNARPLDMALWRYHFENGSQEEVLELLSAYQNEDGGFGHALEADVWNPDSLPMGIWKATEILADIGFRDKSHPVIRGILRYLESGDGFYESTQQWAYTRPSNNDYPHAIWWEHKEEPAGFEPNPNAALAGFILAYADKDSDIYKKGCSIAKRSYDYMLEHFPVTEKHIVSCYLRLYEYCLQAGETGLFDMGRLEDSLREMVDGSLCMDVEKWGREYVAAPSCFIRSRNSFLYSGKEELVKKECELIKEQQSEDGSFAVPWTWCTDYAEHEVAKNWWKSQLILEKLLFLREFA